MKKLFSGLFLLRFDCLGSFYRCLAYIFLKIISYFYFLYCLLVVIEVAVGYCIYLGISNTSFIPKNPFIVDFILPQKPSSSILTYFTFYLLFRKTNSPFLFLVLLYCFILFLGSSANWFIYSTIDYYFTFLLLLESICHSNRPNWFCTKRRDSGAP